MHCALFGYVQVPSPGNLVQSSSVNFIVTKSPVSQDSGQHRLMSFPQSTHHEVESSHVYDAPHPGDDWRQASLSFGWHFPIFWKE